MVPYLQLPVFHLFGQPIRPFVWLVALAIVVFYLLAQRRVRAVGLWAPLGSVGLFWTMVGALIGSHVLEVLAYYPERLIQGPQTLIALWEGFSSFGGFIGGTLALYIVCRRHGIWILPYLDAFAFGLVPAWIIARFGCFVSHDHPGLPSDFFLAVDYPGGPRHDLGFYEMLLAAVITLVLYALRNRRTFVGFYTSLVLLIYAPARFLLDFLRTGDRRYLGLTAAQYLCGVMLIIAITLIVRGRKRDEPQVEAVMTDPGDAPDRGRVMTKQAPPSSTD